MGIASWGGGGWELGAEVGDLVERGEEVGGWGGRRELQVY